MMGANENPAGKPRLGEILLERGLITKEHLDKALRLQVGGLRRLGHLLIQMRCISDENLTDALSEQLKLPIVKVGEAFSDEVRSVLPRYLCRKNSVIPLSLESDNILRLAMADPLDGVAISDVEHFTGHVVQPVLARLSDIDRSIAGRVAFSRQDLFNPQVYRSAARVAISAALVFAVITGILVYRQISEQRYGTVSRVGESVIFKNHDLMIDLARDGSIYFSGRGAYANGYYGVRFENPWLLDSFVKTAARQFSAEQKEWIDWVLREKLKTTKAQATAKSG